MTKNLSDETLMLSYQRGELQAFEELYRRYSPKIWGFLKAKGGRALTLEAIEDLFQKTFLQVHQKRHYYSADYAFSPWIFTLCRNLFIDHLRQVQRTPYFEEWTDLGVTQELREGITPMLEGLDSETKDLFLKYYEQEESYLEIGKALKVSEQTLRKRMSRGLSKLREIYAGQ